MIKDAATGKPRGYAFIEFEHERDMHGKWNFRVFASVVNIIYCIFAWV